MLTKRFRIRYSYLDEAEEHISGLKPTQYRTFFTRYQDLPDLERILKKKFLGKTIVVWDSSEFPSNAQSIWIRWNGVFEDKIKSFVKRYYQTVVFSCYSIEVIGTSEIVRIYEPQLDELLDVDGKIRVYIKYRSWHPTHGVWMRLKSFYQYLSPEFRTQFWKARFDSNAEHEDSQTLVSTARFAAENEPDLFHYFSLSIDDVMEGMLDIIRNTRTINRDEVYGLLLSKGGFCSVRGMNLETRKLYILSYYILLTSRRTLFYEKFTDKVQEIFKENKIRRVHGQ